MGFHDEAEIVEHDGVVGVRFPGGIAVAPRSNPFCPAVVAAVYVSSPDRLLCYLVDRLGRSLYRSDETDMPVCVAADTSADFGPYLDAAQERVAFPTLTGGPEGGGGQGGG